MEESVSLIFKLRQFQLQDMEILHNFKEWNVELASLVIFKTSFLELYICKLFTEETLQNKQSDFSTEYLAKAKVC